MQGAPALMWPQKLKLQALTAQSPSTPQRAEPGSLQVPATQTEEAQSPLPAHAAHLVPLATLKLGALQHTPVTHAMLVQSLALPHGLPMVHGKQLPPQSMLVSSPFWIPSAQLTHVPPAHWPLAQSPFAPQLLPS